MALKLYGCGYPSVFASEATVENGYIKVDANGYISLEPSGLAIAEKIYERHTLFSTWLTNLGVDPQIAQEDACRIEHVISEQSFAALKKHVTENNEI